MSGFHHLRARGHSEAREELPSEDWRAPASATVVIEAGREHVLQALVWTWFGRARAVPAQPPLSRHAGQAL